MDVIVEPLACTCTVYSSSLRLGATSPSSSPPAHAAGDPTTIEYTHFSSSFTFRTSFSSPHSRITVVDRAGPFQHVCPLAYSSDVFCAATISPESLNSSTLTFPIRTNRPICTDAPPFFEFCLVRSRKQCSYVYSPESLLMHTSLSARNIDAVP